MTLPDAAQAACPNHTPHTSPWKHRNTPTSQNTIKTPSLSLVSSNSNLQIHNGTKIKIFSKLLEEQNKTKIKIFSKLLEEQNENNNKVRKRSILSLCPIQFIHGSCDQFFTIVMIWSKFSTCNWQHGRVINTHQKDLTSNIEELSTHQQDWTLVQFQFMILKFQGSAWQGNRHLGIESLEYTTKQGD